MQKDSVAEVLRSLATGDKARSETARLRDVFPDVEAALRAGVSREAILEALHGQGFTMKPKSFESALYRIRRERGKTAAAEAPAHQGPASANAPAAKVENPSGRVVQKTADTVKSRRPSIDFEDFTEPQEKGSTK